jgi:hypothetical protein
MAIKTFTTGEVLTASDTNTYLANSGLVYITSATIGTAVSSVTVSNCFSSTYDNYKIVAFGGTGSTNQAMVMTLNGSTASYYSLLALWTFAGAQTNIGAANVAGWSYIGESGQSQTINADVFGPNLAKFTQFNAHYIGSIYGVTGGYHGVASAYTGFTISVAGTMTGGTITVYGYRKA